MACPPYEPPSNRTTKIFSANVGAARIKSTGTSAGVNFESLGGSSFHPSSRGRVEMSCGITSSPNPNLHQAGSPPIMPSPILPNHPNATKKLDSGGASSSADTHTLRSDRQLDQIPEYSQYMPSSRIISNGGRTYIPTSSYSELACALGDPPRPAGSNNSFNETLFIGYVFQTLSVNTNIQ